MTMKEKMALYMALQAWANQCRCGNSLSVLRYLEALEAEIMAEIEAGYPVPAPA